MQNQNNVCEIKMTFLLSPKVSPCPFIILLLFFKSPCPFKILHSCLVTLRNQEFAFCLYIGLYFQNSIKILHISYSIFIFVWYLLLGIIPFQSIHVVPLSNSSLFFFCWVIFHQMDRPQFVYPFICWWTFRSFHRFWLLQT